MDSNILTSYADNAALMTKQQISPIIGWEGITNIIEQWLGMINMILDPQYPHPAFHKITVIIDAAD